MQEALKRRFEVGEYVYVVDYWGTSNGTQAFEARADIISVDEKEEVFSAILYGDTVQTYSFQDYGRLIFDNRNEAREAAQKLPKPQTTVYQVRGKSVEERVVDCITGKKNNGVYDIYIRFDDGRKESTQKIGHSLFLSKKEAIRRLEIVKSVL